MKTSQHFAVLACALCLSTLNSRAANWYVATNGNDAAAGTNWVTAKATIQAAIDDSAANDTVWVSNGVYATGGRVVHEAVTNRVVIDKIITVQSVNGPEVTVIQGSWDPVTTNGPAAVRCVYVGTNAMLSGFTLTNGALAGGSWSQGGSGGGAWCEVSGILSNCVLTGTVSSWGGGGVMGGVLYNCALIGNRTHGYGGGAYGALLYRCALIGNYSYNVGGGAEESLLSGCTLMGNSAGGGGGGSAYGRLTNCTLIGNSAGGPGGGSAYSVLYNCTLAGNSANNGGGSYYGTLYNCISYFNTATSGSNYQSAAYRYSCTTPDPGGSGNITNNPQFVDAAAGNYHLSASSPCIDRGTNAYVQWTTDLDGKPRIVNGSVDMGAYEFQGYWAWAAAITNGLTNYTDCATGDGYPNLLKYVTGSSATNSDDLARLKIAESNGLPFLVFNRNTNVADATVIVQGAASISNDAPWEGLATNINGSWGGTPNVIESGIGNPVICMVRDATPAPTNRFLRLAVTRP